MPSNLVEECARHSIELLSQNAASGLLAAAAPTKAAQKKHYTHVFARDLGVCSLGIILSGQQPLIRVVRQSLITLGQKQAPAGQIPNHIDPENKKGFYYYLGCLDATLWWLLAIDFYDRWAGGNLKKILKPKIGKAFQWLFCQDTNQDGLLEQGEASDWADVMPNNGAVLYTNILWYWALRRYRFFASARLAKAGLNSLFLPTAPSKNIYLKKSPYGRKVIKILRRQLSQTPYYLPYVSFKYSAPRCDVYANILAVLLGVASPARSKKIIGFLLKQKVNQPYPVQALTPPIKPEDNDWRPYLGASDSQNYPYGYHNGGSWPFIGGFWLAALFKTGYKKLARLELEKLAQANQLNNWQFREWLNGQTGQVQGMVGQSWNAGSFLFAYHYLREPVCLV